MPSYIVKIDRDTDRYVYWSTIVDAPLFYGNRAEMENYLQTRANHHSPELAGADRFERANETGTSSVDGFYDWDDTGGFMFEQRGTVQRSDIPELVRLMDESKSYDHLVTPWVDDEDELD